MHVSPASACAGRLLARRLHVLCRPARRLSHKVNRGCQTTTAWPLQQQWCQLRALQCWPAHAGWCCNEVCAAGLVSIYGLHRRSTYFVLVMWTLATPDISPPPFTRQQHVGVLLLPAGWTSTRSSRCLWARMQMESSARNGWKAKVCVLAIVAPVLPPANLTWSLQCSRQTHRTAVGVHPLTELRWGNHRTVVGGMTCKMRVTRAAQWTTAFAPTGSTCHSIWCHYLLPTAAAYLWPHLSCRLVGDSQLGRQALFLGPSLSSIRRACAGSHTARQGLQPVSHKQPHHRGHIRQAPVDIQHQPVSCWGAGC